MPNADHCGNPATVNSHVANWLIRVQGVGSDYGAAFLAMPRGNRQLVPHYYHFV